MKIKILVLAVALLLSSSLAGAGPFGKIKNFVKTHPKFSAAAGTLVVGSTIQWKGTTRCEQGFKEVCNIGYGPGHQFDTFSIVAGVGLLFAGNKCSHDQPGWWFCNVIEFGVPAYQTYAGLHDYAAFTPCEYGQAACGKPDSLTIKRKF